MEDEAKVTVNIAASDEFSIFFLSTLGGIFASQEKQRSALKDFLRGKDLFAIPSKVYGKRFVKTHAASQFSTGCC